MHSLVPKDINAKPVTVARATINPVITEIFHLLSPLLGDAVSINKWTADITRDDIGGRLGKVNESQRFHDE